MNHTYYKDRRVHINLTGGPVIVQMDTPLGIAEVCCTYNGLIFNKEVSEEIRDVINSQLEICQEKTEGVLGVITLPWVESSKEGYYTNASPKTLRIPKGFGEGYASEVYIASPIKRDYVKLFMLSHEDYIVLTTEEFTLTLDENAFSEITKKFVYDSTGKRLVVKSLNVDEFMNELTRVVGGNWFMPFMNYAVDVEIGNAIHLESADKLDTISIVSEAEEDKHHIYMGDNNYREFESIPESYILDNHVDGTIHYARKRDYIAVLMTKNNAIEYALVYNGTDTRFTSSHTRMEVREHGDAHVELRDFSFGRKLPSLKEAIDELIKTHRKHKLQLKEVVVKEKKMARGKMFPTLQSIFGSKK